MSSSRQSFSPARRWKIGFDVVLRTALVLAVVLMVNYFGAKFSHRYYLSQQTRVELSSRTLTVLHSLTNQVEVTLYYDTHDRENFYADIVELLNTYRAANKNISIRTVDYLRDAGEAAKVKEKYNLPGSVDSPSAPPSKDLIIFASGSDRLPIVIPGEAIVQTKLEQVAPANPNQKQMEFRRRPVWFNGEILFTAKLLALQNPQPLKAYFLQGDGEGSLADTDNYGYSKFGLTLAQNYFQPVNLELASSEAVPDDCSLLIIAAPTVELDAAKLQKIDRYLADGGRLLLLLNYASIRQPTGLESIVQRWGVAVAADYVKDPQSTITGQDLKIRRFGSHPVVNPLTQLSLQMILPRPVMRISSANPTANAPQVEELAFAGENSTLAMNKTLPPQSYPLIVAVEQKPTAGAASPRGSTRIIVAGDSVFLGNHYIDGGGNRDFVGYAANWLCNREQLLSGIAPRPVTEFRLLLTQKQNQQLRWLLLGALPGGVLVFGWLVWLVRRK